MRTNLFPNTCLVLIVVLLGIIAFRHETTSAHAAEAFSYEVVPVDGTNIAAMIAKETQDGWEPMAVTMSRWSNNPGDGFVLFRK